jgi:4-hydroxybenzoate polyprenyltransferase
VKIIKLLRDLLFLTRPVVVVPVWGFALFGYRLSVGDTSFFDQLPTSVFLKIILFSFSVAAVYVANQIEDFDVDVDNGGFPLLIKSGITKKSSAVFALVLALISVVVPLFLGEVALAIFSGSALVIGYFYSFKPFYFTGRPFLDFLSNGLGYGLIAFLMGWSCGANVSLVAFSSSLPYLFMMFAGSISSTLPDLEGDATHNKKTTAVLFGKKKSHLLATLLLIVALILAIKEVDIVAILASAVSLPFYFTYIIWPKQIFEEMTYKVGGAASMIAIGFVYPLFIGVGALVAVATILYFRLVFGVSYPSLLPVSDD